MKKRTKLRKEEEDPKENQRDKEFIRMTIKMRFRVGESERTKSGYWLGAGKEGMRRRQEEQAFR